MPRSGGIGREGVIAIYYRYMHLKHYYGAPKNKPSAIDIELHIVIGAENARFSSINNGNDGR